jgi:peroxiredoxin
MRINSFAAMAVAAVICAPTLAQAAPKVGDPAPDFTVTTFGGHKISLADLKGDVIVLNFWATWCAPCKRELPLLEAMFRKYSQYNFQVLAVTTEDSVPDYQLKPLAAKLTIPLVKSIRGPYHDLGAVPTNYVIDRSGKLIYAKAAAFDIDAINAIIIPLLNEPMPPAPSTAPPVAASAPVPAKAGS